jgi:hypothetical protein
MTRLKRPSKKDETLSLLPTSYEPNILMYEFNLWRHPIFFIDRKSEGQQKMIDLRFTSQAGEGYWRVAPSMDYGAGGPFEDLALIIINKLINEMPRPISNPINIGPLSKILAMMGYEESKGSLGGWPYERLKLAIRRMASLTISTKYAFFDKDKGRHLSGADGVFHILDSCLFIGETDGEGNRAEANLIWLNATLLKSINRRYVGPIDLDFYQDLKPVSRALFKILQVVFFATKGLNTPANFRYSTICDKTTITRQKSLSLAKNVLNQAHDELTRKGYLKDHRWEVIKGEKGDWKILYWPGAMADKFSALHVPAKAIHWLTNTDGDTPQPAVKQLEMEASPTLFDVIASGVQLKEEGKGQQQGEGAYDKEHREIIERSIEFYVTEFKKHHGNKPLIVKNRDHAIIRELITNGYSEKDIRALLRLFLLESENEFVAKSGYTLPVFKTVINTFVITLNMKRKVRHEEEQKKRERKEFEEFKKAKD